MNTSQNKNPMLTIGGIAFLAIAVIGMVYDFITKAGGWVAIPAVIVAFLILAVVLIIDAISRKRAMDRADEEAAFDNDIGDNRFLRHTEDTGNNEEYVWKQNDTPRSGFAGFNRRGFGNVQEQEPEAFGEALTGELGSGFENSGFEDMPAEYTPAEQTAEENAFEAPLSGDQIPDIDDISDDEVYSFTEEELAQEAAEIHTEETAQPVEQPEEAVQPEDDPFKPVLKLTGSQPEEKPQEAEPAKAEEVQQEAAPEAPAQSAPVQQTPEKTEPVEKPVEVAAAVRRAAAAVPAASVSAAVVGGQTIESFYDEMSDEDILYRDCVEVWAADAKPAALRLIKYVEGIEDKQTAALIGREVEYINAMIDRINCFTQLEYIDELLEYKEHNYSTLVKDCLKRFSPFFMEKRLGLLWKGLDINVMTDRRWFIFALTQVIFNAAEFTPNGGKIAISAKKHEDYIDLTVEDSGKGISPEELPFIFMAGYMGDDAPNESGRRTGMGLFIAQSVMRKMGGDMLAESTPGKGTRITMRMPIIEP